MRRSGEVRDCVPAGPCRRGRVTHPTPTQAPTRRLPQGLTSVYGDRSNDPAAQVEEAAPICPSVPRATRWREGAHDSTCVGGPALPAERRLEAPREAPAGPASQAPMPARASDPHQVVPDGGPRPTNPTTRTHRRRKCPQRRARQPPRTPPRVRLPRSNPLAVTPEGDPDRRLASRRWSVRRGCPEDPRPG